MSPDPCPRPETEEVTVASLEAVQRAAGAAADAIARLQDVLEDSRRLAASGMPLPMLVDSHVQRGGQAARHEVENAVREFERTFRLLRSDVIRRLVEDHGYSMTEVGRTMRISRQMAARLLESGRFGTSDLS